MDSTMPTSVPNLLMLVVSAEQGMSTRAETILRNRGWRARAAWAADTAEVEEILSRTEPELVLCDVGQDIGAVCGLARQLSPELAVVAVAADGSGISSTLRNEAFAAGAVDIAAMGSDVAEEDLAAVCLREYRASRTGWELREARMRQAEYESRQRTLVAETSRALLTVSEGIIVEANPAAAETLGFASEDDLIAQPFLDLVASSDQPQARDHLTQLVKQRVAETEFTAAFRVGDAEVAIHARISARQSDGDSELQLDAVLRPQAVPRSAESAPDAPPTAAAQTFADIRESLGRAIETALSAETQQGVLYFRIDGFAAHEERLGLIPAARVADTWEALIAEALPPQSWVVRMAPDELCAVAPAEDADALAALAESLRQQVAHQNFRSDQFECHITHSTAVYPLREGVGAAAEVLRDACFEARRISGEAGNTTCSIGDAARAAAEERKEREAADELREALKEGQRFQLAYQNIASLGDDTRQIYDVLVRMRDASGNERHAREFLPIAERFGLMPQIDLLVLTRAVNALSRRSGTCLMVRLSEASLSEPEAIVKLIETQQPAAGTLALQLRESVVQHHVTKVAALREKLRSLSVELVLDYFGDSPGSSTLLEHVRPDYVKFNPAFAARLDDEQTHERLAALVKAAHNNQSRVIVPFVENTRIMGELWQMGINYVQGNGVQEAEVVMLAGDRIPR